MYIQYNDLNSKLTAGDPFHQGLGTGFWTPSGKNPLVPPTAKFIIR